MLGMAMTGLRSVFGVRDDVFRGGGGELATV